MSNRLNQEREAKLQPKRMQVAIDALRKLNVLILHQDKTKVIFTFNGNPITFYAYSGWHTGKGIKDGRGLQNLLKQLKP